MLHKTMPSGLASALLAGMLAFCPHTTFAAEPSTPNKTASTPADDSTTAGEFFGGYASSSQVSSPQQTSKPQRKLAVASDQATDPVAEAAREILQQNGSILQGREALQDLSRSTQPTLHRQTHTHQGQNWPTYPLYNPGPHHNSRQFIRPTTPQPKSKVATLRQAAWQLDTTAQYLENIDLYEQADALRETATRFRHDARKIKQRSNQAGYKAISPNAPARSPRS